MEPFGTPINENPGPLSIVWRDDDNPKRYEEARIGRLFNRDIPKRYPLAIVFAKTESDVLNAVELAIQKNYRISIRAGGHSWHAWNVRDEAILVDLGHYSEIVLDEQTGVACVSPSTTGRDIVSYLLPRGRTLSVGHYPDVGIGGFLLGGGLGWNCNNWGWACEQVVVVDAVTTSGDLVRADAQQNSDLFWAARGSGPGFPGIITRCHLQTRHAPKFMHSSGYVYRMSEYRSAFEWILKFPSGHDEGVEIAAVGSYPAEMNEPCLTVVLLATGDEEEALSAVLQRAENSHPAGTIDHWFCQETNLHPEFENKAKEYPENHRYCVDNAFLKTDVDVATILEPAYTTLPTRKTLALWSSMMPCSRRKLPDMAVSLQSDHYFALYSIWELESEDSRCRSGVSDIMVEVGRHPVGSYLGESDFQARPSKFWGDAERGKIMDVRRKWDPEGRVCGFLGLEDIDIGQGTS